MSVAPNAAAPNLPANQIDTSGPEVFNQVFSQYGIQNNRLDALKRNLTASLRTAMDKKEIPELQFELDATSTINSIVASLQPQLQATNLNQSHQKVRRVFAMTTANTMQEILFESDNAGLTNITAEMQTMIQQSNALYAGVYGEKINSGNDLACAINCKLNDLLLNKLTTENKKEQAEVNTRAIAELLMLQGQNDCQLSKAQKDALINNMTYHFKNSHGCEANKALQLAKAFVNNGAYQNIDAFLQHLNLNEESPQANGLQYLPVAQEEVRQANQGDRVEQNPPAESLNQSGQAAANGNLQPIPPNPDEAEHEAPAHTELPAPQAAPAHRTPQAAPAHRTPPAPPVHRAPPAPPVHTAPLAAPAQFPAASMVNLTETNGLPAHTEHTQAHQGAEAEQQHSERLAPTHAVRFTDSQPNVGTLLHGPLDVGAHQSPGLPPQPTQQQPSPQPTQQQPSPQPTQQQPSPQPMQEQATQQEASEDLADRLRDIRGKQPSPQPREQELMEQQLMEQQLMEQQLMEQLAQPMAQQTQAGGFVYPKP